MSSRGNLDHSGARWALGAHGFVIRLNHSTAFNGIAFVENETPPPAFNELNLNNAITGYEYVQTNYNNGEFSAVLKVSEAKVNGSINDKKFKENDQYISGNQFAFVWKYDDVNEEWSTTKDVFSWFHSSAGDGPVGILYNGGVGNFYPEGIYNNTAYVGIPKYQVGMDSARKCFRLVTTSGIYEDDKYADSIQGIDSSELATTGALTLSYRLQAIGSSLYHNGKVIIKSNQEGTSQLITRIIGPYDVNAPPNFAILGCGPISSSRVLLIVGIEVPNLLDEGNQDLRIYFIDVSRFGEEPIIKVGNNDDNSYLISIPSQFKEVIDNAYTGNEYSNTDAFIYPWRFSQDLHSLSCLTTKKEIISYTIPSKVDPIIYIQQSMELTTYSISYNQTSDSYSLSQQSKTTYSPHIEVSLETYDTGGVPPSPPPGGTYTRNAGHTVDITLNDCIEWPVALNYKDNQLKTCFIEMDASILTGTLELTQVYTDEDYDEDYVSSYSSVTSYSGFIVDGYKDTLQNPQLGSRYPTGTLVLADSTRIDLRHSGIETIDSTYSTPLVFSNSLYTSSDSVKAASNHSVFFIDAANSRVLYGKRGTQIGETSTSVDKERVFLNPPEAFTFPSGSIVYYDHAITITSSVDYVGGTQLYSVKDGVTSTLINLTEPNSEVKSIRTYWEILTQVPILYLYPITANGVRHPMSPYRGVFNDGATNIGLFSGDDLQSKRNYFGHDQKVNYNLGMVIDPRNKELNSVYWMDLRQINVENLTQASDLNRYEYFNGFSTTLFDRINLLTFSLQQTEYQSNIDEFINTLKTKYSYLTLYPIGLF